MNTTITCAFLVALTFAGCAAAQDDRNTYYYANGERVPVVVAPSSVVLRFSIEPDADLIARLGRENDLRLSPDALYSPLRRNRMVVYSVDGAAEITNRYIADLQDRLARSGAPITDVARVLTTARGAVAALTQQLSVGFVDGVANLGELRGLDVERFVSILHTMNERPLVVAYRVNADSELTALEIANAVYEYEDASGRRLVTYAAAALQFPAEFRTVPNLPRHPNDELYDQQWHLNGAAGDIDAPQAWDYTRGSTSALSPGGCVVAQRVRIAVFDSGVQMAHLDLRDNLSTAGKDYTQLPPGNDPNPTPTAGDRRHGTQAAGVIAACGDNTVGVSGVCPLCEILPIKIEPFDGMKIAAGLYAAASTLGADVVSGSWGTDLTEELRIALNFVTGTDPAGPGIPVFIAMANEPGDDRCATDVSGADAVIAISGSSKTGVAGAIASSGNCIDLVAPTLYYLDVMDMVITTDLDQNQIAPVEAYTEADNGFGGTSAATAVAAGIGGLVLSLNPELTQRDIRDILQHTADKITIVGGPGYNAAGFSPMAGYGRVNAHRAVVPIVKITAPKTTVQVNEAFTIKVSASAPHLLSSIGWSRTVGGCPTTVEDWRPVAGKAFHEETWSVTLSSPGVYTFRPNAKDARSPPITGYPHLASDAFPTLPKIVVNVQGTGAPAPTCPAEPVRPNPPTDLDAD